MRSCDFHVTKLTILSSFLSNPHMRKMRGRGGEGGGGRGVVIT